VNVRRLRDDVTDDLFSVRILELRASRTTVIAKPHMSHIVNQLVDFCYCQNYSINFFTGHQQLQHQTFFTFLKRVAFYLDS